MYHKKKYNSIKEITKLTDIWSGQQIFLDQDISFLICILCLLQFDIKSFLSKIIKGQSLIFIAHNKLNFFMAILFKYVNGDIINEITNSFQNAI